MCCPSSQIGWYSQQREDTNISFASINLLWRVADYLARIQGVKVPSRRSVLAAQCLDVIGTPTPVSSPPTSPTHATQHSHSTLQSVTAAAANSFITSPPPNAATPSVDTSTQSISSSAQIEAATVEYVVLSQQATDSLMHSVFAALRRQATDDRSQVRNSAVKTLGQALLQHGVKMKPDTWYLTFPSSPPHTTNLVSISHAHSFLQYYCINSLGCLLENVFPLLRDLLDDVKVNHKSDTSFSSFTQILLLHTTHSMLCVDKLFFFCFCC
jgi:hypothetical protein